LILMVNPMSEADCDRVEQSMTIGRLMGMGVSPQQLISLGVPMDAVNSTEAIPPGRREQIGMRPIDDLLRESYAEAYPSSENDYEPVREGADSMFGWEKAL